MIHPHTEVCHTGTDIGLGVFATALIPIGTIVYAMDSLEIVLPPDIRLRDSPCYAEAFHRYAYQSPDGRWIINWDHGKYVNHNCEPNTLSTGYGFEIAVRDILPGEEMTTDYGMCNIEYKMPCLCGAPQCRGAVRPGDFDLRHARWDSIVRPVLTDVLQVEQLLWSLLDHEVRADLQRYCRDGSGYRTVRMRQYVAQAAGRAKRPRPISRDCSQNFTFPGAGA